MQPLARRFSFFAVLLAALGQIAPFHGHFCPMQAQAAPAKIVCAMCPQNAPLARCLPCCISTSGAVWASAPLLKAAKVELPAPPLVSLSTATRVLETPETVLAQVVWYENDLPPPRTGVEFSIASRGPPAQLILT